MADCTCDDYGNTGQPACITLPKEASQVHWSPLFKADGTRFSIPKANVNEAGLTALINQANPLDRLYPSLEIKNPESPRSDAKFETFPDDSKIFLADGTKSMKYWFPDGDYVHLGRLNEMRCKRMGFYILDKSNNYIGEKGTIAADIYPFEIAKQSMHSKWMDPTGNTTGSKIETVMDMASSQNDKNSIIISGTDLIANDLNGLITLDHVVSGESTTGFVSVINVTDYDLAQDNLLPADFLLENLTTVATVTIIGSPETPDGTYTFSFVAQTSADVLQLSVIRDGFDDALIIAETITIP